MASELFDWTISALSGFSLSHHPTKAEVLEVDRCMEEAMLGQRESFLIPIRPDLKEQFLVRAGKFGVIYFHGSKKAHISQIILMP
jgi:hypothetical protein